MMSHDHKTRVERRLRRIEGQIRGIIGMVEQGRHCIEVLAQTSAAIAALRGVEDVVMTSHLEACVAEALRSGDQGAGKKKIDEVIQAVGRVRRHG
jgi:DNA-binding FrmR family transcriptional regulator